MYFGGDKSNEYSPFATRRNESVLARFTMLRRTHTANEVGELANKKTSELGKQNKNNVSRCSCAFHSLQIVTLDFYAGYFTPPDRMRKR